MENKKDIESNLEENKSEFKSSNNKNKKIAIMTGCALLFGVGAISTGCVSDVNDSKSDINNSENETQSSTLEFTIEEDGVERDRTAEEMREFYTPEGEEFIKAIYPDSTDSDLALLNIGRSIEKELSNIEFITASDKKVSLKDLKGKKVILDFALTTCPSCKEEFEYLSTKEMNKNEVLLHIFPRSTTEEIKDVFKELGIKFNAEHTVSTTGMNNLGFEDFNVTHVPTKLFINEEGIITYVTTDTLLNDETYSLHYERAYGEGEKLLDYLKNE